MSMLILMPQIYVNEFTRIDPLNQLDVIRCKRILSISYLTKLILD